MLSLAAPRSLSPRPAPFSALLAVALLLSLAACSGAHRRSFFGGDIRLEVSVDQAANRNSAVAVELLVVDDPKVLDAVLALSAADWFGGREQFRRDHPKGYSSWAWEWVPGQTVPPAKLSFGIGARGGVVFADYLTPGKHRVRFAPHSNLRLTLGAEDLTVEAQP